MDPKRLEIKCLNVPFEVKATSEDEEYFTWEGYASTFGNVDLGDDVVLAGAFAEACRDLMAKPGDAKLIAMWHHRSDEPIGVFVELREDVRGLFVRGRMPRSDSFVSGRVWPQMKCGAVTGMSIGYWAKEWDIVGDIRRLKKLGLREISLVTTPMNPQAQVTALKSIGSDDLAEMTPREIESALKSGLPMSNQLAKTIASMLKAKSLRDGAEGTRDAGTSPEEWSKFISEINNLTKKLEA